MEVQVPKDQWFVDTVFQIQSNFPVITKILKCETNMAHVFYRVILVHKVLEATPGLLVHQDLREAPVSLV